MKLRESQKPGTQTPSSAASISVRSQSEPGAAAATMPEGTPITIATNSAEHVKTSVGSARSRRACVTGRSRKYDWPRSPRRMRP